MKAKTFLILLLAAGLLAALVVSRFGGETNTAETKMGNKLLADLPVNQVAAVTFADAENQTTLLKGGTMWRVEERSGYPANFDELRDTVVKLSRLKIGRSFAGSPESLVRLSLLAPADKDAAARGKQITLKDAAGKILADVILGKARQAEDGAGGGQYLRHVAGDTVFLVDGDFRFLNTTPAEWLRKEILNIKAESVETVTCYAGDNPVPVYTLSRPEKGQTARMSPAPQGRSVDTAKVDQVFDALAPLSLDDVHLATQPPTNLSDRYQLDYRLYDGRLISIFPAFDGKENYTLQVTAQETETQTMTDEKPAPTENVADSKKEDLDNKVVAAALETAQQLNEALSPWIFSVKKWQFDSFITQPTSLLEALEKEGDGTS